MQTVIENIPNELRALDHWVCANANSKQPLSVLDFGLASVTRPDTWATWNELEQALRRDLCDYAGFVFNDTGLVGIDIDHAFDDDGLPSDEAWDTIKRCDSYTEISKSGNGLHIICRGEIPFRGSNNLAGWEIYKDARYFVLTGDIFCGYGEIKDAQAGIDHVLATHFTRETKRSKSKDTDRHPRLWEPQYIPRHDGKIGLTPTYPPVSAGGRHVAILSFCGHLWHRGYDIDDLLEEALNANEKYMIPPMEDEEVERIVKSVSRYER